MGAPHVLSSTTSTSATATGATFARPSTVTAGCLLVAYIGTGSTTPSAITWGLPTGWTVLFQTDAASNHVIVAYKVATGSEPTSYGFTQSRGTSSGILANVATATPSSPFGSRATTTTPSSTAAHFQSVTTSSATQLILEFLFIRTGAATASTPSGLTKINNIGSGAHTVYLFDKTQVTAGATGTFTSTLSTAPLWRTNTIPVKSSIPVVVDAPPAYGQGVAPPATAVTYTGINVDGLSAFGQGTSQPAITSSPITVQGLSAFGAGLPSIAHPSTPIVPPTPEDPGYAYLARQRGWSAIPTVTYPAVTPDLHLEPIPRVSETYTPPFLVNGVPYKSAADLQPGSWTPASVTSGTWAKQLQVLVSGQDVTFFRTKPVQVQTWGSNEPFGDATATMVFPAITSFDHLPQPIAIPTGPVVGICRSPSGNGYWLASSLGTVSQFGDAAYFGDPLGLLNTPVVGIAAHPTEQGYVLAAADGGVFTFGAMTFHGSVPGTSITLGGIPIVAVAVTATGLGYWLCSEHGAVYSFGDAVYHGGITPTTGLTAAGFCRSTGGAGYAIVDSAGKVHGFGDASTYTAAGGFLGPALGIGRYPGPGDGYVVVDDTGHAYAYGSAVYEGGVTFTLNQSVNGVDLSLDGAGYWMVAGDGGVFAFGDALYYGSVPNGGTTTHGATGWVRLGAPITIRYIDATDNAHVLFEGVIATWQDNVESGTPTVGLQVQCVGALYQLDWYLAKPIINLPFLGYSTVDRTPIFGWDTGTAIATAINSALYNPSAGTALGSGPPPAGAGLSCLNLNPCAPVATGIITTQRGAFDQLLSSYIQGILSQAQQEGGEQYTLTLARYRTGPLRTPLLTPKDFGEANWAVSVGARGIAHQLSLDISQSANAIYGQGTTPTSFRQVGQTLTAAAGTWSNTQYPRIPATPAPTFPGTTFTPGAGTTGLQPFSDWMRLCGYSMLSQDTYLATTVHQGILDEVLVQAFQLAAGLEVTGAITGTTWASAFEVGSSDGALNATYYAPLWELPEVDPFLRNPSGGWTGENPDFNPGIPRVERYEQMGQQITKAQGILSASIEGARTQIPAWTGTIQLTCDPEEGSRFEILAGQNILLRYFHGQDTLFHISAVQVTFTALTVTLTVASQPTDLLTVAAVLARDAASYGVSRQARPSLANLNVSVTTTTFDATSGAGMIPATELPAFEWVVIQVPFAQQGSIAEIDVKTNPPTPFSMAVFSGPVTPAQLQAVFTTTGPLEVAATGENPWNAFAEQLDALGLLYSAGGPGSPCGYWPSDPSGVQVLSGEQYDGQTWPYVCSPGTAPWLFVAFYAELSLTTTTTLTTPSSISGRIYPAPMSST